MHACRAWAAWERHPQGEGCGQGAWRLRLIGRPQSPLPLPAHPLSLSLSAPLSPSPSTGTLSRDFKHLAVDMFLTTDDSEAGGGAKVMRVEMAFGKRKQLAAIRTRSEDVV